MRRLKPSMSLLLALFWLASASAATAAPPAAAVAEPKPAIIKPAPPAAPAKEKAPDTAAAGATGKPPGVRLISDIVYSSASKQDLDLCLPAGKPRKTIVVFIHGGGFRSGSKEQMNGYCQLYAKGGFASASINYRLTADGEKFPAPLDDTRQAVQWIRKNAAKYGYSASHVVLAGYSSGGNLALMAGLNKAQGTVRGVVSVAGPIDLPALAKDPDTLPQIRRDINAYIEGQDGRYASPLYFVTPDDPHVLLFHGQKDTLVPSEQALRMARQLKAKNVPVQLRLFPNGGHDILLPSSPYLKELLEEMTRFLMSIEALPAPASSPAAPTAKPAAAPAKKRPTR